MDDRPLSSKAFPEAKEPSPRRLEALGLLSLRFGHQLNNLLGVMHANAELLERLPDPKALAEPIRRAAGRAGRLNSQMLAMAEPDATRRCLALAHELPASRELLEMLLGPRIALHIEVAPEAGGIEAAPGEFLLALANLALHARRAIFDGAAGRSGRLGEVRLQASAAWPEDRDGLAGNGYATICLSDDGPGLDESRAEQLFSPVPSDLGLGQVRRFCEQLGGRAGLRSTPGLGTAVTMVLPAGR